MKWYMTPGLWAIVIAGLALLVALWFAPRKSARANWLALVFALGATAWTIWGPTEYVQNVSVDNDNNVVVAAEVLSRDWALRPTYSLKIDFFNNSGRRIRTHSIKLPGRDYHGVSALKSDAEGNIFMGLTPDRGGQPLLAKASSDGRVLWMANTVAPVYDIKITGSRVETIETSSNETRLACERFDSKGGRPMAEWSRAFPLWSYGDPRQVYLDANGGFSANAGDLDHPVLVKFTPAGQTIWKTPVRDLTPSVLYSDAWDNHYLGGGNKAAASIMKFGPHGDQLWSREVLQTRSGMRASIRSITGVGESVFVYGIRLRPIDAGAPISSFEHRAFIAGLSLAGKVEWLRILKGRPAEHAPGNTAFAVDRSGNVYVAQEQTWKGNRIMLSQFNSAGRLKWRALAPDPSIIILITAALAFALLLAKIWREKRVMRDPAVEP